MDPFLIKLQNGKQVGGYCSLPADTFPQPTAAKPLVVLFHGGTYGAKYWDAHPEHSIVNAARALGIPVIAPNAPSTLNTTGPDMSAPNARWFYEQARMLNDDFLPAIWEKYGPSNGCTTMFLWGHSLGGCRTYVTAGQYFEHDVKPAYPLGGILLHGEASIAFQGGPESDIVKVITAAGPDGKWPTGMKEDMFLKPAYGLGDPKKFVDVDEVNEPLLDAERDGFFDLLMNCGKEICQHIRIPVMNVLGSHDCFFQPTDENLYMMKEWLCNSPNVRSVKLNSPHGAEWSQYSAAYYIQGLGFALECAIYDNLKDTKAYSPT